jgi:DNA-binding transcriptional LysR family regulator
MADVGGIDLNLLVALGALLEDRNLTRAGARIGLSQPAMSAALARLRKHFGDDLLARDGRGYKLTELGAQLLPTVQEALRQMEATMDRSPEFEPESSDREFSIAASDYTISILADPLLRRVKQIAPGIRLELHPIPNDMSFSAHGIVKHDVVVGPTGYEFPGRRLELFRDRFVCLIDPANPRLRDGKLTLEDISALPHVQPTFGHEQPTPADRLLDSLGIDRHVQVTVVGWLTVPFVVAGTGLVAIVPERLARRVAETVRLAVVEPPFGQVDLIETAHWHPSRGADPAVRWLLHTLQETAAQL